MYRQILLEAWPKELFNPKSTNQSPRKGENMSRTFRQTPIIVSHNRRNMCCKDAHGKFTESGIQFLKNESTDRCSRSMEHDLGNGFSTWGKQAKRFAKRRTQRNARRTMNQILRNATEIFHEEDIEQDIMGNWHFLGADVEYDYGYDEHLHDQSEYDYSWDYYFEEVEALEEEMARAAEIHQVEDHAHNMAIGRVCFCDSCTRFRMEYYRDLAEMGCDF